MVLQLHQANLSKCLGSLFTCQLHLMSSALKIILYACTQTGSDILSVGLDLDPN